LELVVSERKTGVFFKPIHHHIAFKPIHYHIKEVGASHAYYAVLALKLMAVQDPILESRINRKGEVSS